MYDVSDAKRLNKIFKLMKNYGISIQKSVWVGPSPLPKDFLDYIKHIDLLDKIKMFKLAKPYSKNN